MTADKNKKKTNLPAKKLAAEIKFDEEGLVPAILQDEATGKVLMMAYMNKEALNRTLAEGRACFYSRSREELWLKGETSGNYQLVKDIRLDCDGDTLLLQVEPVGPACHTGEESCFYRRVSNPGEEKDLSLALNEILPELEKIIAERKENLPAGSYTAELFQAGVEEVARKVGEESLEVVLAALKESPDRLEAEAADLLYHLLVLLRAKEQDFKSVQKKLRERFAN